MKKTLLTLLIALIGLTCNAQIFKSIKYYDKFDDVIKSEQRKTLITKTDSTFIIEEKGKLPITYYILNPLTEGTMGSKDNIVNLINNVYGYQQTWCVIRYDKLREYREAFKNWSIDFTDEKMNEMQHYWLFIVHRTITTQYTGMYLEDLYWVADEYSDGKLGKNVNRIIYLND